MNKLLISFLVCFLLPCVSNAQLRLNMGADSPLRKLQVAEMAITNMYVDSVDEQNLVEDAIRGMLKNMDPHSTYSTAKETQAMTESLNGSFEWQASESGHLLNPQARAYGFGPSFRWGLFNGQRIRNNIRVEEASAREALASYEQTVLQAYQESEDDFKA